MTVNDIPFLANSKNHHTTDCMSQRGRINKDELLRHKAKSYVLQLGYHIKYTTHEKLSDCPCLVSRLK